MKKTTYVAAAGALAFCVAAYAAPQAVRQFRVAPRVAVAMPAMSDSVDNKGVKYSPAMLLDNRMTTDFNRLKYTVADADTAGRISFKAPANGYEVILIQTPIRAERFAKGNIEVTSTSCFEVLVNNESKAKKTTAQDSLTDASTQKTAIELEPERDYTVTVKLLAEAGKGTPEVAVKFVPDADFENVPVSTDVMMKRRFYVDNCVDGTRVSGTAVSADGKYVLVRYQEYFAPNDYRRTSTVIDAANGRVVAANLPANANWMPKGSTIYYTQKSKSGYNLYTMSVPQMKTDLLMRDIESAYVNFTPDEKSIIYYREAEGKAETGIMRRITSPDDRQPGDRDRRYLVKQDVASGNTVALTYGSKRQNTMLDISPDSRHMLYLATQQTPDKCPFYYHSLVQMDINTLATDTIIADDGMINNAQYSPDGRKVLVMGGPNMLGGITLNAGNNPIANDFDTQMAIVDIATGNATQLTKDFAPAVKQVVWNHADGNIYFTAEDGFYEPIFRYVVKSGKFEKLPTNVDVVRSFSMPSTEGTYISYSGSTNTRDGAAWLYNVKKNSNTLIDDPQLENTGDVEFGKTEPWKFTASDGTVIDGEITLPPGFDPSKKYPLIVYYYGGTSPSEHRIDHPYNANVFASRDYVVYIINPSGTTGYGQEFSSRHVNAWGKRTADDIIEGVKEFVKQHPFVDEKKIGCLGASYGGFMTQYLQTKTDIFAAAVSHAGISDVTSYWGEGYWGYSYNSVAAAQSYPWTNPELFTQQGSLFNADKIHTPLLLLHGTEDTNVPIGESIQIFNALKILGRDVEFITVDGANHVVTDPDKRRVWQNTIMAWFAKYLQDSPQWWNSMYGDK